MERIEKHSAFRDYRNGAPDRGRTAGANALVSSTFFNKFSRTILFIPVVISTAATGVMFGLLLDETIGYIPYLCGMLGFPDATFFRNASTAMGTIIAMTVWKNFGYTMSILVVGIQGVSQSYYEAARIDGASKVQQFFYITLPGFCPTWASASSPT